MSEMWSLFVANLDPSLRDTELADFFRKAIGGEGVFSAQVVLDRESSESKNFGYVHYTSQEAYKAALDEYPEVEINGRLAKCFAAEDKRKIYVRGIPRDVSDSKLQAELRDVAGEFVAVNIRAGQDSHTDSAARFHHFEQCGRDQGFCFVTYVNPVRAEKALKQLEGATISGSTLHAEPAKPPKSRDERRGGGGGGAAEEANSSLHVRNIGPESTQESIKALFAPYGEVREVRLPKNRETGANAGFGFVEFETSGQAAAALAKLNHATLDGRTIDVAYSRNKALGGGRRDGRDDDRRGGRDGYAGGRDYGHGPPPPMMGYPAYPGYPAAGGRGGAPAFPYGYMPYGMPMAAAGGRGGRETGTAFPAAYPGGQAAYPYMDPRYMAQYAMMAAQQQQGGMPGAMPGAGGFGGPASAKKDRRRDDSRSPSRSRSRSPPRRGGSRSRSRSRSRDRKRR